MSKFSKSLQDKIEELLNRSLGDISRLEYIKQSIIENKKLYNSDIEYVENLALKNGINPSESPNIDYSVSNNLCWKCKEDLVKPARYCSFCGADQINEISDFDTVVSRRSKREYNPLKIISNFYSYQILAVLGGLVCLISILFAISNIERIFELIEFYSGQNLSGFLLGFLGIGAVSALWCLLVIVIPFWIKKPKKIGKFLFYSSFVILIISLMVGIVGFPIILFSGILALKKRRY